MVFNLQAKHNLAQEKVNSKAFDLTLRSLLSEPDQALAVDSLKQNLGTFTLLDARAREEYEVSHLQNARWVGYEDFEIGAVADLPKETPLLVYCSIGYRSEKISQKLEAAGYSKVVNLYGGIFEWMNRGYPLFREGEETDRIHAYSRLWGIWLNRGEKVY